MVPCVVSAVKSGAMSLMRRLIVWSSSNSMCSFIAYGAQFGNRGVYCHRSNRFFLNGCKPSISVNGKLCHLLLTPLQGAHEECRLAYDRRKTSIVCFCNHHRHLFDDTNNPHD